MKKKVLIYAFLEGNLGDDLMVDTFCRRYPRVQFQILAHEYYKDTFRSLKNVRVYGYEDHRVKLHNKLAKMKSKDAEDFFLKLVRESDGVIHVGGSVYNQHDHCDISMMIDHALRERSKRMYVCGANFGPYRDEWYFENYHELLSLYDGVSFRDRYSYEKFGDLPKVGYAPDLVWNYDRKWDGPEKKQVLISAIDLKSRTGVFALDSYQESYRRFLTEAMEHYIDAGYEILLAGFCKSQKDSEANEELMAALPEDKRSHVRSWVYEGNLDEVGRVFGESEIVIGTRFHSVILGWLANKKVLPLVYSQKTKHTLEDLGIDTFVELDRIGELSFPEFAGKAVCLSPGKREEVIKAAEGQFRFTDQFLQEK